MFNNLRIGDFVRWSIQIKQKWYTLPNSDKWYDEPNCAMEIINIKDDKEGDERFELECVNSCGNHNMTTIERSNLENLEIILGHKLLEFVSMSELHKTFNDSAKKDVFDFAEIEVDILNQIVNDTLVI